jgi:hypothetical protein
VKEAIDLEEEDSSNSMTLKGLNCTSGSRCERLFKEEAGVG